jgi:Leucine-rich repeat (LRR) protein
MTRLVHRNRSINYRSHCVHAHRELDNRPIVVRSKQATSRADNGSTISRHIPLTRLDVSQMKIDNLTVAMLGKFRRLVIIDAGFSDVKWVEPEVFGLLPDVETLHLEAGRLTRLDGVTSLKRLRRLYVQENRLEEVIALDGLYALVSVDMSYNRLKTVPSYWLNGLRNLQVRLFHVHASILTSSRVGRRR